MNILDKVRSQIPEIEAKIGYVFNDKSLLALSLVHRSFVNENRNLINEHNERLEFLGDSVLGLIISEYLYKYLPETPEGELSYLRSRLVEASSCVGYVQQLDIESHILLGKGEQMNDGRGRDSILADLFEAVIGAIFLDGGMEASRRFLFQNFSSQINGIMQQPDHNWKALLQDYSQKNFQLAPRYIVIEETGPDHSKTFDISVQVNKEEIGRGQGSSKKEAQQAAAKDAMKQIGIPNQE
ncbi:MAG: Ribonuclease 3 [Chlamydiae bacterium]|nr:Ribonuclease 3 [Chlamydiota bacterium]